MNLADIKVFRMIHIDNIPHILQNGITHRNSPKANSNYVSIGDDSLIDARSAKNIKTANGNTICLGDFIPFYFWVKMPMLYIIQNGYHNVVKRTPEEIIYIVCSVEDLANNYEEIYFSDGHANSAFSTLYDKTHLCDLPNVLDWNAIKATFWDGEDKRDLKRRKEAEFLVKEDVSPQQITTFGCYSESAKQKLIRYGIDAGKIKVNSQAYY